MDSIECPYCGSEEEIDHDDGFGYEQDVTHQMQCSNCEKNFVFTTYISFSYNAEKADCLNDGEHDYQPTHTYPKAATRMRCTMCDDTRDLTDEERNSLGIETVEEYFKSLNK
jgi:hypothetical protein